MLQEAMKRILKQKPHAYEIYNKCYKVIKVIFSLLSY